MKRRSGRRPSRDPDHGAKTAQGGRPRPGDLAWLAALLAVFALLVMGAGIRLPFVGDDYVFLDKTRAVSLTQVLSPAASLDFGWYRPWSREVHFWLLQHVLGTRAIAFRCVNGALWVAALSLYAAIVGRLASYRVAAIATLGVAAPALWGALLLWVSGCQDLWMLVLTQLALLLFIAGRARWAVPVFALALLSKETAAVLPALLLAYVLLVERQAVSRALRRTAPLWGVLVAWVILHPTLRLRMGGGLVSKSEMESRPPALGVLLKTAASCLNLDRLPHPRQPEAALALLGLLAALVLAGGVALAVRRYRGVPGASNAPNLARWAGAWALIGWTPLLMPSVGWHAYYGCLGALGAWFGLALWLESRPRAAIACVAAIALLRVGEAETPSVDFGDESYFRYAGSALAAIEENLMGQHGAFPPHSRVYFEDIPYHVGLIAGQSPAIRVWYADSTLQAGFYSYYRPRRPGEPLGTDYFFRCDSVAGMVEVVAGDEDVRRRYAMNRKWEEDHDDLAKLFLSKGDLERAAVEYEKLAHLRRRPDAALYAAACRSRLGQGAAADSLRRDARTRLGASDAELQPRLDQVERNVQALLRRDR